MRRVSLGCPVMDETFGGGLPGHGLVEVAGMAGSGKTQLMLQLLIQQVRDAEAAWRSSNYAAPFLAGRSFYLSTEGAFPAERLQAMAAAACPTDSGFAQRVLESVIIMEAKNVEDQLYILTAQLPTFLADANMSIRLCVVDSMSALFRGEFSLSKADTLDRAKMIFAMAKQMKKLSHEFHVPFVATNQVTADFSASSSFAATGLLPTTMPGGNNNNHSGVQPALGLSWSNCVHTRFLLTRQDGYTNASYLPPTDAAGTSTSISTSSQWVRQMRLLLSPSLPSDLACRFVVEMAGVRGLRSLGLEEEADDEEGGGGGCVAAVQT